MTKAQLIALINQYITSNHNNEITGLIQNGVLQAMVNQINDLVGDLSLLNTVDNNDIVEAINWVVSQLGNSVQIHAGVSDPNVTPPGAYAIGDFYSQEDGSNNPVALWVYDGVSWVNLTAGGGGPTCEEKTYTEILSLIGTNDLTCGTLYKITEATQYFLQTGFGEVYLRAISDNELASEGEVRFRVPKYDRTTPGYNVWDSGGTYAANDVVFWGGCAWENVSGNVGVAVDALNLDAEWTKIQADDVAWATHYNELVDACTFKIEGTTGRVTGFRDKEGSYVEVGNYPVTSLLTDPIMMWQWGNEYSENDSLGISGWVVNGFIPTLNCRGEFIRFCEILDSRISNLSMEDDCAINQIKIELNSAINTLDLEGDSNINTLNLERNSSVNTLTLEGNSGINTLSLSAASNVEELKLNNQGFGNIHFENVGVDKIITDTYIKDLHIRGVNVGSNNLDFTGSTILPDNVVDVIQLSNGDVKIKYINQYGVLTVADLTD